MRLLRNQLRVFHAVLKWVAVGLPVTRPPAVESPEDMNNSSIVNSQFMSKIELPVNKSFDIIIESFKLFQQFLEIFFKLSESPYFIKDFLLHYNSLLNKAKSDKMLIHIQ